MDLKKYVVQKPWGEEYLIYENDVVAVWCLQLLAGHKTSLHCHPLKTTGLILVSGEIELSFLEDKRELFSPAKAMIRRGLFHSSKAISKNGAIILEIETPNDKFDLIRLQDDYGRDSLGYEKKSEKFIKRNSEHIWIDETNGLNSLTYRLGPTIFEVTRVYDIEYFRNISNDSILAFLKGGLGKNVDGRYHLVTVPGDVLYGRVLSKICSQLESVAEDTLVLYIKK